MGVIGSGTMGMGIAEVGARGGWSVVVVDTETAALDRARAAIEKSITRAVSTGKLVADVAEVMSRLTFTQDLAALAPCPIVIEAIRENLEDKVALFTRLDTVLDPRAIIATNTSSIPVAKLAAATAHPGRVLGLHFFNPVPVMPLVEVVPSLLTEDWATEQADAFTREVLGKKVIRAKDRAGFVVNAILVPYLLSAIRSLDNGVASRDDLDTMLLVAESLYSEYLDPSFSAPALLRRHVDAGWLGRKSGRGFYDYSTKP